MKIGAVLVPINTRLRTEDVAYIVDQSDSSTLILAERSGPIDYLGMVRELVPEDAAPARAGCPSCSDRRARRAAAPGHRAVARRCSSVAER